MFSSFPFLSLLIWLPIFGGLLVMFLGNDNNYLRAQFFAFLTSILVLAIALVACFYFDSATYEFQFIEKVLWVAPFNIYYHLGVDGISWPLILLTVLLGPIVVIAGCQSIHNRLSEYLAALLIMQGLMCAVFASLDAILFYVFWEAMLIPMFLIIGIWGGQNRVYATIKFFLYTFLGSVFMLLAVLYLCLKTGSFNILDLYQLEISPFVQGLLFFAFLLAFAVKVPMWPFHTWLPDAHVQAPTGGSVILAAIMLKMGGYGFLRFTLPILPIASMEFANLMILLSLMSIVYIGFVAIAQSDMKKLIAYSSIAHMGFVTLGFFSIFAMIKNTGSLNSATMALEGSMMQMLSHGFISGALFLCVGVLYDRMHSRNISDYGGVANVMPCFAAMMMVFIMANSGLPATSGFIGEFMIIISSLQAHFWIAILAATILILGPAYNLWLYKRVIYGDIKNEQVRLLQDLKSNEFIILGALVILIIVVGIWPSPLLKMMHSSIEHLLLHVAAKTFLV